MLFSAFATILLFVANIFFGSVEIPFADVFEILIGGEP